MEDKLYTQEELAKYLGVKKTLLIHWRHQKKGPSYVKLGEKKTGVPVRYAASDVKKWLSKHTVHFVREK